MKRPWALVETTAIQRFALWYVLLWLLLEVSLLVGRPEMCWVQCLVLGAVQDDLAVRVM